MAKNSNPFFSAIALHVSKIGPMSVMPFTISNLFFKSALCLNFSLKQPSGFQCTEKSRIRSKHCNPPNDIFKWSYFYSWCLLQVFRDIVRDVYWVCRRSLRWMRELLGKLTARFSRCLCNRNVHCLFTWKDFNILAFSISLLALLIALMYSKDRD